MADLQGVLNEGTAYAKQGKTKDARKAFQKLIDSRDPSWSERGRIELGALLRRQGDLDGATSAFEQAIRSGHPDWAPCAATNLAGLMSERGNVAGAVEAYKWAESSGHPEWAPKSSIDLGTLLSHAGDDGGAELAYRRAVASGHSAFSLMAHFNLGVLLAERGDTEGARNEYQAAIDSRHAEWAPKSASNLGIMLMTAGDFEGARAAYNFAIASNHPQYAPKARNNLAIMSRPGSDPTTVAVRQQSDQRWDGTLRAGEQVVFNVNVTTPKMDQGSSLSKNFLRSVGKYEWDKSGIEHAVTITSKRMRVDGLAFDFDDIASYSSRSWQPKVDTGAMKFTYAVRRRFALSARNGTRIDIEFADNYPGNGDAWTHLSRVADSEVVPRLVSENVGRLRSGGKYTLKSPKGTVLLELGKDGLVTSVRPGGVHWAAYAGCGYDASAGQLTVKALNDKGKAESCASFIVDSWLQHLLKACYDEFH
jgi:Flp pilus assembly protein TadD